MTLLLLSSPAVCFQCGADSLGCDRLGCFNLSIKGHGYESSEQESFQQSSLFKTIFIIFRNRRTHQSLNQLVSTLRFKVRHEIITIKISYKQTQFIILTVRLVEVKNCSQRISLLCWLTVGRLLSLWTMLCRWTVGQLLVDSRAIVVHLSPVGWPTVGWQTADSQPTVFVMFQT